MSLAKRTYSLPPEVISKFETRIPAGDRSSVLAQLIQNWVDDREREELRQQIVEGCKEMDDVYREVDREWASTSDEVWHGQR